MDKIDSLLHLEVEETEDGGYAIYLDDKQIHHVESYTIKPDPLFRGAADLTLELLVKYP